MRFSILALGAIAACGGTAVVDGVNQGGGGSTTTTSTSSSTTTSPTTTTSPMALCADICDAAAGCIEDPAGCVARCAAGSGGCVSEQQAYLDCVLALGPSSPCETPALPCNQTMYDYLACREATPVQGECDSFGDECSCITWDEANHYYESFCEDSFEPGSFCYCVKDETLVGTCRHDGDGECPVHSNCCSALVFTTAPP